jgi:hypothetical protein
VGISCDFVDAAGVLNDLFRFSGTVSGNSTVDVCRTPLIEYKYKQTHKQTNKNKNKLHDTNQRMNASKDDKQLRNYLQLSFWGYRKKSLVLSVSWKATSWKQNEHTQQPHIRDTSCRANRAGFSVHEVLLLQLHPFERHIKVRNLSDW